MTTAPGRLGGAIAGALLLAGCGSDAPSPAEQTAQPVVAPAPPAPVLSPEETALLRSQPLKDAIHRALTTVSNQRWQDGDLSGYAVPSLDPLPNGCRTVRYTVDQRPDMPVYTINACNAGKR